MSLDHEHFHDEPDHPGDRPMEAEDPMLLSAVEIDGDPQVMLDCLVEELARMGWSLDVIMRTFEQPFYAGANGLLEHFGKEGLRERIRRTLSRCGVMRFRTIEQSPPEEMRANVPAFTETKVALTIGGRHAARS
jgi:hypothetical protein